jgi:glycogen debranching enzyme
MAFAVPLRSLLLSTVLALGAPAYAEPGPPPDPGLAYASDAAGSGRFVATPGERGAILGYPDAGLEVWAYPLQILSGWRVRFHESGRTEPLDGRSLLRRVEYRPNEIVRVYAGPDFVVREHLFVPRKEVGAIFTYEVEGRPEVQIEARFEPSLNLMWPGALGGQSIGWDAGRWGYVEREPLHGFSAVIRSPQAVAHDEIANRTTSGSRDVGLVLEPRGPAGSARRATVYIEADLRDAGGPAPAPLEGREAALQADAEAHARGLLDGAVRIETPDAALNKALSWSVLALDQTWVCQPALGCGMVAGYGPSRPGRRPQYAWFFAGDGLVGVEGLLAAGEYERAREELAFITRYQDPKSGMIWHEMSLSAPLIDWRRYPYMFVHVDITLQYLSTLAAYAETTGDRAFLETLRPNIEAAWRYSLSLIDPATGLPAIPAGKEGQNEQDELHDDLRLSSAWIGAADAYARLARLEGRTAAASEAQRAADRARRAVAAHGWDAARGFWLSGHTRTGAAVQDEGSSASGVLRQDVFGPAEADQALDRLASPDLQSDWGVRSLSADAPRYDPNAYSRGSVWAHGTSAVAETFWAAHRPLIAFSDFHALVPWSTLDSEGHLHEVLAGDLFHPEMESVPEQTWSSAGFLAAAVNGLLGLEPRPAEHRLVFEPHLPGAWNGVAVRNLRVGPSRLALRLTRDDGAIRLEVDNDGPAVDLDFAPEIPLGARLEGAEADGRSVTPALEAHAQDQHARLHVALAHGRSRVTIRYAGGVRLAPIEPAPQVGDRSRNLKIRSARWENGALAIDAWVAAADRAAVELITPLKPLGADGARVEPLGGDRYRLVLTAPAAASGAYAPVRATVRFAS